jgi:16S rRNA (cytosine967-C5)-methyltransferase
MAGHSLAEGAVEEIPPPTRPAAQDIVYGVLRRYGAGEAQLRPFLKNPPYPAIHALLFCALYRLETWTDAPHTVVHQAVAAAEHLEGGRYKGLVNGVLRNFLRQQENPPVVEVRPETAAPEAANDAASAPPFPPSLPLPVQKMPFDRLRANGSIIQSPPDDAASLWHPDWWIEKLTAAYPERWQGILAAGNQPPPMSLRVNVRRGSAADYLARLQQAGIAGTRRGTAGILLTTKPVPVSQLPGFYAGDVSVQDLGAQRAAELLHPAPGSSVLDACAAPGGKTAHLLEGSDLTLTALDIDPQRCRRIEENLARLSLSARVRCGDASMPRAWGKNPQVFDAILADVPCSASGVVRRCPDIKWLRQPQDVLKFALAQRRILERLWAALTPGGKLLYATCSVFLEENQAQVEKFLRRAPDARLETEEQLLPEAEHDGFYYALLRKAD